MVREPMLSGQKTIKLRHDAFWEYEVENCLGDSSHPARVDAAAAFRMVVTQNLQSRWP